MKKQNYHFSYSYIILNLDIVTTCNREFKCISNLIVHLRTHTGDKPYKCKYCSKTFASAGNKMAHMKRHLAKKQFQCDICKVNFRREHQLDNHVKEKHTNRTDEIVEKLFQKLKSIPEKKSEPITQFKSQALVHTRQPSPAKVVDIIQPAPKVSIGK